MKVASVVQVLGALLLLHHHDASVDAFLQSSTGYLNSLTLPKSMPVPMQGYLDSLGNTATAFKDNTSPSNLPPRYEAEYPPRRHDFSKVAVYPSPSVPAASTVQQSNPVSQQTSSEALIGTGAGTRGTSMYQYAALISDPSVQAWYPRQSDSPSELLGRTYMNMMGAAELAASRPSAETKPELTTRKEVSVAKDTTIVKEAATTPRGAVSVEKKIVEAPKLATTVSQPQVIKPAETPFAEKKAEAVAGVSSEKPMTMPMYMSFTGYLDSLAKMWSTEIVEAPKLVTNVASPEAIKPAETPFTEKKAETVSVWSAQPKPEHSSTAFGGYIGSLTKPSSEAVVQAADKTTPQTVQATPEVSNDTTAARLETVKLQSNESSAKPKATSTSFGGYLGSLTKSSDKASGLESPVSRKVGVSEKPETMLVTGYLGSRTEKLSTDDAPSAPVIDSSQTKKDNGGTPILETVKLQSNKSSAKPKAVSTSFGGYLGSLTNSTYKATGLEGTVFEDDVSSAPVIDSSQTKKDNGGAPILKTVKLQSNKSSAKPKAVSTSFGGYLGSLKNSTYKATGLEGTVFIDDVPSAPVVDSSQTKKDIGGMAAKPTSHSGYLDSLMTQKSPEDDLPCEPVGDMSAKPTSHSGYLDSLMTQKSPEDDLPCEPVIAPSHTKESDGAATHAPFFAVEETLATEEEFEAKIDFSPKTPAPAPAGGVPAHSEVVADDDLPSWVKEFMIAEDAASIETAAYVEKDGFRRPLAREKPNTTKTGGMKGSKDIWQTASPMVLQGGALRTWSEPTGSVERVQVSMKTEGRSLNANVELWHGADNTPLKMSIYSEDGGLRPFNVMIETPAGPNTIAIRNTGQMEFPLAACVGTDVEDVARRLSDIGTLKTIQSGAIHTYPFDRSVASVQVLLKTGGRPLNARIELMQGPNNDKQVINISTEDGLLRPFFAVIETPGTGNVVRVVNTGTLEFPMTACVQPYLVEPGSDESERRGWDHGGTGSFRPERRNDAKYESRKGMFE